MSTQPPHLHANFATDLPELCVPWQATPVEQPKLVVLNDALAESLGLDTNWLRSEAGTRFLLGEGEGHAVAQGYAGHQFGSFSPRLGDGRALLLGELESPDGRLHDLHLKGSGPTPFSRGGDGFAALGPMLREYLISEAIAALGIPTTRILAVIATGRPVWRDGAQPGAIAVRLASSHLRVGTFEYARLAGDLPLLQRLVQHALQRHYPEHTSASALLREVVKNQARLVAAWQGVGFIHGVLNTDNTTISGQTIDYGPCAFLDAHDPATVFSSIDSAGRYAFGNQPAIIGWNLARLAEALLPLLAPEPEEAVEQAREIIGGYADAYRDAWAGIFTKKLGLSAPDEALFNDLEALLAASTPDHTLFFRALAISAEGSADEIIQVLGAGARAQAWQDWFTRWRALHPDSMLIRATNPSYIPRNHLVEHALNDATDGDLSALRKLHHAITNPFTPMEGFSDYTQPAPADFGPYRTYCGT